MERNPWMNSLERMDEEVRKENESLDTYIAQSIPQFRNQAVDESNIGPTVLIFRIFAAFLVIYGNFYQFLWLSSWLARSINPLRARSINQHFCTIDKIE